MSESQFVGAGTVCAILEVAVRASIRRTQSHIEEAQAELQRMLAILNQARAVRGLPPLDATITPAGSRQ